MKTVKMLLPLTVALLLSISPAAGLKCYDCFGTACSSSVSTEIPCPPNHMCMAATIQVKGYSTKQHMNCANVSVCPSTGAHSLSVTNSKFSVVAQVTCCNTDFCNTKDKFPPVPTVTPGQMKCPRCDPANTNCKPTQCNTLEDSCYKAKHSEGCATANTCASKTMSFRLFYLSTGDPIDPAMTCYKPVLLCEACLDPCSSCSQTTTVTVPPGKKCVAATIRDSASGKVRVMKAVAGAPLCSEHPGPESFNLQPIPFDPIELPAQQTVQVTCCDEDLCNSDVPDFDESVPLSPVVPCIHPDLLKQLHLLVSGAGVLPESGCNGNLNPPH